MRGDAVVLTAHAKINLVLELLGPRDDGYTELATVYQSIELGDTVILQPAPRGVTLADDGGVGEPPERNLAVRAAEAWLRSAGEAPGGVRISLEKRVPARAGLGGGSADAAAVLRGLDAMYGPRVPSDELHGIAAGLGADVPFFLVGGTVIGRGRGERLEPLPPLRPWHLLLVRVGEGLSTADVFARARRSLTPASQTPTILRFVKYIEEGQHDVPPLCNHLLPAAVGWEPDIGRLVEDLEGLGAAAGMTGSGSTVFGLFESSSEAVRARSFIARRWPGAWTCTTRTRGSERIDRTG